MPSDMAAYLCDLHNGWHFGSSASCIDLTKEIINIEKHWNAHRDQHHISEREGSGGNSYEKVYWQYIKDWKLS